MDPFQINEFSFLSVGMCLCARTVVTLQVSMVVVCVYLLYIYVHIHQVNFSNEAKCLQSEPGLELAYTAVGIQSVTITLTKQLFNYGKIVILCQSFMK